MGILAYHLALPPYLDGVHDVFYVSMLKKYIKDASHIIRNYCDLEVQSDSSDVEEAIKIWVGKRRCFVRRR